MGFDGSEGTDEGPSQSGGAQPLDLVGICCYVLCGLRRQAGET